MRYCLFKSSRGLKIKRFTDNRDRIRERRGADVKGAFDDAGLAADVACAVRDCRVALA